MSELIKSSNSSLVGIVAQILAFIQKRGYSPGERLPSERDLAERFAVGRGLIREALTTLETIRYLERRPNSGVFLHKRPSETSMEALVLYSDLGLPLDEKDIHDSLEARRILDVQAVQIACQRRTQEEVDTLNEILEASQKEIDHGRSIATLDEDFHLTIFKATHNNVIVRLVRPFYLITKNSRRIFFEDHENCIASHNHHVRLAQYIAARDIPACAALMAEHIGRVEKYYDQHVEQAV